MKEDREIIQRDIRSEERERQRERGEKEKKMAERGSDRLRQI